MMKLLQFQREAVDSVVSFYEEIQNLQVSSKTKRNLDRSSMAWITSGHSVDKQYCSILTAEGTSIPNVAICIPTGGGKTIVGLSAAIEILNSLSNGADNFIVWMVPSEAIYSQVLNDFSPNGTYYDFCLSVYGRKINLKQTSDTWIDDDLDPKSTTILLLSFQSIIRKNSSKSLQVYRNADKVSSLSALSGVAEDPSLYLLLTKVKPIFIIDESHRYYTEIGRDFFKQDNISRYIIELSATHKQYSSSDYPNIVFSVNGKTLISEQLIKKPIVYHSLPASTLEELLKTVIDHQLRLENKARVSLSSFLPKVLISSEFTGAEQAGREYSAQNIKAILIKNGIASDAIAIKSSELDELSFKDLDDPRENIRFVITKRALMEGWDCKSIFTIMLVNKIGADITNFQLIGRGLRQPNKSYSIYSDLNELHLFTNSISHDSSIKKLTSFLSDSGLSDSGSEFVVAADSRVLQRFYLVSDFNLNLIDSISGLISKRSYLYLVFLERNQQKYDEFVIDENEVHEPEEITQKIDLSKQQLLGVLQGRPNKGSMILNHSLRVDYTSKLYEYLFNELNVALPISSSVHSIVQKQLNRLHDHERAFNSRSQILLKIKSKIDTAFKDFSDIFYINDVVPTLKVKKTTISEKLGTVNEINSIPDLALDVPFLNCLYGNIPKAIFNESELAFARYIDSCNDVAWMRNSPVNGIGFPYPDGIFYPDFLIIKNSQSHSPQILFVETKGAHLIGNANSKLKLGTCDILNKKFSGEINLFFGDFNEAKNYFDKF